MRFTGLLDELCAELAELRQAADPARSLAGGRGRAPHACGGRAVCGELFHHADGGGGRQRRRGDSRRDAGRSAARSRLCQQWRRHRAASGRRRAVHGRPDRPARQPRPDAHDGHRCRRSDPRHRDQRPPRPQFLARHCRCRDGAGEEPPRGPTLPRPSSPMPSICPAIPPSFACRPTSCSPTAISAPRLVTRDVGALSESEIERRWTPVQTARAACWPPD